ncbi:MAG: hypothetical protein WC608_03600 [Parcubacteria group bacterium]
MVNYKKLNILAWREDLVTLAVIAFCLLLVTFFPASGTSQFFTKTLFFLLVVPILYIKLILKKSLSQFGFNLKNPKPGILWSSAALGLSLLLFFAFLHFYPFSNTNLPNAITVSFWAFLFYELVIVSSLFFLQQFFTQGFALFSFKEKFGIWSIVFSFLVLLIFLLSNNSLALSDLPLLVFFLTGSLVSYKSGSFIYSYAAGLLFFILTHSYLIHLIKNL